MVPLGIAALALGGAAVIAGLVTGGLAWDRKGIVDDACNEADQCHPEGIEAADEGRTFSTISTVTFIAGGVLAAAGVVLIVTAPDSETQVTLSPAGIRGFF